MNIFKTYQKIEVPTGTLVIREDGDIMWCEDTNSTSVTEWTYFPKKESLHISYAGGNTYIYAKVPSQVAVALIATTSLGKTVNELVKKAGYKYSKAEL